MVRIIDGSGGALLIPGELDSFEVRVATVMASSGDGPPLRVRYRRVFQLAPRDVRSGGRVHLPQTLAVVPDDVGGSGTVRVDVWGLRNGRVLQHLYRTAGFGIGLVELPPFALTPLCFGVECPEGQTCEVDGECRSATVETCGGGPCDGGTGPDAGVCGLFLVECADTCVPYDDDNCGTCGVACAADERCIVNRCVCGAETSRCADGCRNLNADTVNCGACGVTCEDFEACEYGVCKCPGALSACGTTCVDLRSDRNNCGACGVTCPAVQVCSGGSCQCPSTGTLCGSACVDLAADPAHCGSCDTSCGSDETCTGGACVCRAGLTRCGSGCKNLSTDTSNCGACGNVCSYAHASAACSSGTCSLAACDTMWESCDGVDSNGCETPIDTTANCGWCGHACGAEQTCDLSLPPEPGAMPP